MKSLDEIVMSNYTAEELIALANSMDKKPDEVDSDRQIIECYKTRIQKLWKNQRQRRKLRHELL